VLQKGRQRKDEAGRTIVEAKALVKTGDKCTVSIEE
jgi:hypothetical protein